jgi:hypothetical protein
MGGTITSVGLSLTIGVKKLAASFRGETLFLRRSVFDRFAGSQGCGQLLPSSFHSPLVRRQMLIFSFEEAIVQLSDGSVLVIWVLTGWSSQKNVRDDSESPS